MMLTGRDLLALKSRYLFVIVAGITQIIELRLRGDLQQSLARGSRDEVSLHIAIRNRIVNRHLESDSRA
jgi:hypothetical protein